MSASAAFGLGVAAGVVATLLVEAIGLLIIYTLVNHSRRSS